MLPPTPLPITITSKSTFCMMDGTPEYGKHNEIRVAALNWMRANPIQIA
jgi:hypothetical protein